MKDINIKVGGKNVYLPVHATESAESAGGFGLKSSVVSMPENSNSRMSSR